MLLPAAVIVFGAGMLSASGTAWHLNSRHATPSSTSGGHFEEVFDFSGSGALVGFAGIVLGILTLAGNPSVSVAPRVRG